MLTTDQSQQFVIESRLTSFCASTAHYIADVSHLTVTHDSMLFEQGKKSLVPVTQASLAQLSENGSSQDCCFNSFAQCKPQEGTLDHSTGIQNENIVGT